MSSVNPRRIRIWLKFIEKAKDIDLKKFILNNEKLLVKIFSDPKRLKEFFDDFILTWSLIKDYSRRKYTDVDVTTFLSLVGSLIYVVSWLDAIPDPTPVVGYLDDLLVFGQAMRKFKGDLDKYRIWKENATASVDLATI
jgi:uncharacterized membrane protein YkvA (DUF1232 family)